MDAAVNLPADPAAQPRTKFRSAMGYSSPVVDLAFMIVIVAIIAVSMIIGHSLTF